MQFKKIEEYDSSYGFTRVYTYGTWRVYREGRENEYGGWDDKGDWIVERKSIIYGEFKTLKESKAYIRMWININPNDK